MSAVYTDILMICFIGYSQWYAVMLNYVGDYEGTKQKLKYSYIVETHFKVGVIVYYVTSRF